MRKVLITGAAGQDGSYLAETLLEEGDEVHGLIRPGGAHQIRNLIPALDYDNFNVIRGDLLDPAVPLCLLNQHFDEVYHLAAQSHIAKSFTSPTTTWEINAQATLQLLEALRLFSPETRFFFASTADIQPTLTQGTEDTPKYPRSPYAAAKLAAHNVCEQYRAAYGLNIGIGILYPHESARRDPDFFTMKIIKGLVQTGSMTCFTLSPERDWCHALDIIRGEIAILREPVPGTYVLASGVKRSLGEFAGSVCAEINLPPDAITVEGNQADRPLDVPCLWGNPRKAEGALGWQREVTFTDMIRDMIEVYSA